MYIHLFITNIATVALTALIVLSAPTTGSASVITHDISVSANTGGNTAANGKIVEGNEHTSIHLRTTINDVVVEEYHHAATGTPTVIRRTIVATGTPVTTSVNRSVAPPTRVTPPADVAPHPTPSPVQTPEDTTPPKETIDQATTIIHTPLTASPREEMPTIHIPEETGTLSRIARIIRTIHYTIAYVVSFLYP